MVLDDPASVKAALALMPPRAREATKILAFRLDEHREWLGDQTELRRQAVLACVGAMAISGFSPEHHPDECRTFAEEHAANVLTVASAIVTVSAAAQRKRRMWGVVGKVAALVGAAALGAFFG
jgi:hypothetical protein